MLKPRTIKEWGNKANHLTTKAATQKKAWAILLVESDLKELKQPCFEDVYEITE